MQLYPKMASKLGQHLLRAKPKAENFGLFALYPCYFLSVAWLPHKQLMVIIEERALFTQR